MTVSPTTLGIIPARGGSKRLPRKNMRLLGGKPLVAWAIEAARGARRLARLVVSSDDPEVLDVARSYDPRLALERPAEISGDESPAIDYVRHALAESEGMGQGPFDAIVILQPSSPFTLSTDIDATVDLLDSSGADSAVSVMHLDHAVHPFKMKVLVGNRLLPYLEDERGRMAAHELPDIYVRNCSVYATRRNSVERGQMIGDDCRGYVMPRERSLDINEELDLLFAEFLLSRKGPG
ncbi:MAG: acylneuraminate cytidylyltransferase family protein [Planctomycetia bacterium]|nr:acylneuraminate cytidylyltransferase family protein [Planctomycetia bacterium]